MIILSFIQLDAIVDWACRVLAVVFALFVAVIVLGVRVLFRIDRETDRTRDRDT